MITITLGKKEYDIPTEMTVSQYQTIQTQRLFLDNSDPAKLLAAYIGAPLSEIKNAKKDQVKFLEAFVFERLTKDVTKDAIFTFDYEGITYGFENDWKKLAWGAWQDLEFLSSENITDNIHRILSVLYRPVISMNGTKYKIEPYNADTIEERAQLFKNIPIKIWFGAAQLFFFISSKYIDNIKNTMESQMKVYRLMEKGTRVLPKWLQKKLRLDSILQRHLNLQTTTSQNSRI